MTCSDCSVLLLNFNEPKRATELLAENILEFIYLHFYLELFGCISVYLYSSFCSFLIFLAVTVLLYDIGFSD